MTVPQLNEDCVYCILKNFQNNYSILFNCLLINRFWCNITVPLLYSNPFLKLNKKQKFLITKMFLLFLNEEERNNLTKQNNIYKTLNSNLFLSNDIEPIFEYPKYIRQLSKLLVYNTIHRWYRKQNINININGSGFLDDKMSLSVKATFYHMFLRKSEYLKDLEICASLFDQDIFNFYFYNTFIFKFSKLTNLQLYYPKGYKNFNQISFVSSIVKQQHGLKELSFYGYIKQPPSNIFSSLEFQKNSLISLKLIRIKFQQSILQSIIKLHNLKYLVIVGCGVGDDDGLTLDLCKNFQFASFELKELRIKNHHKNIKLHIIKYLGKTLQRLKIDYIENEIMEIADVMAQYSKVLETFDVYGIDNKRRYLLLLEPFLKNLNKLEIKGINIYNLYYKSSFIELAIALSITTTKVSFIKCSISRNNLLSFFSHCHNHIITLNFDQKFNFVCLRIILNYIMNSNNSLKYLGIHLDKVWSTEELDLLGQIRKRGVELIEFRSNFKESDYSFSN